MLVSDSLRGTTLLTTLAGGFALTSSRESSLQPLQPVRNLLLDRYHFLLQAQACAWNVCQRHSAQRCRFRFCVLGIASMRGLVFGRVASIGVVCAKPTILVMLWYVARCLRQAHSRCLESGLAHQPDNLSFKGMSASEALVTVQASCMKCVEASDVCDWCALIWQSAS